MSKSHHPRWRPPMANGRAGGTRTTRGADGSASAAASVPHTTETAGVDLAKPMRLRVTPGAVTFLVIGLMLLFAAVASPEGGWVQRVIFALVGITSFWFGWYGLSLAWCRRNLVLDSTGGRVRLKRRCKLDFPWEDLAFVEVVRRPGGYSLSRPGWCGWISIPDRTSPPGTPNRRVCQTAPHRPGLSLPARPHPQNHPGTRRSIPVSPSGTVSGCSGAILVRDTHVHLAPLIRPGDAISFADSGIILSTWMSGHGRSAGGCRCPIVELGHVDGAGGPTSVAVQ